MPRLGSLSAYFLPVRPFLSSDLRVFSEHRFHRIASRGSSSLALESHLSVLPLGLPSLYRCAPSTTPTLEKLLAEAPCPFSISGPLDPSLRPLRGVWGTYLAPQKSRPQGLATLSTASAPRTLGSLSQLPTLLGFPLQSFLSSPVIGPSVSPRTFPSCTSSKNLPASRLCSRGFLPPEKLGLSTPPEGLVRGETICSPEVPGPSGPPPARPRKRASPSFPSPLALGSHTPYEV